jgi:succinate-semialdehyde dehydrogenase/glutarate-semialdehyde dehydrogenase
MTIININPATLETLGEIEETSQQEVEEAFIIARKVQQNWRQVPTSERIERVARITDYIADHFDDISILISICVGKPASEAFINEVYGAIDSTFHYYTIGEEVIDKKEELSLGFYNSLGKQSMLLYRPVGVVGIIGPYNYPFIIPLEQIVQAIMAGNAVVFKPSSEVALIGQMIQTIFDSIDIPKGLLQTVYGPGSVIGSIIIDNANLIVFTGSTETGKQIMQRAAEHLTPVILELGGKDAMVVFSDANFERAAHAARWGVFINSGQVCSSVKRLYVQSDIYDSFVERLVALTRELKQGDPLAIDTDVGAMVNETQLHIVEERVQKAIEEGAEILVGGQRNLAFDGYFFEPTILGNVRNDMECVQKEIFGPVLVVIPFETEEDVIALVNDNPYGLTASIWTNNIEKGEQIAKEIDAGTVMVNEAVYTFALAATPWGGTKNSGLGRSHGKLGFLSMMKPLHLNIDISSDMDAWWMPYNLEFQKIVENFKEIAKSLVVK